MKKEVSLAIVLGLLIGFAASAFFWWQKAGKGEIRFFQNSQEETMATTTTDKKKEEPTPTPTPEKKEKIFLEINQPENESIFNKEKITIEGRTIPNGIVVIIWEEGEDIIVADEEGGFSNQITLVGGENQIEITAYDEDGNSASRDLTIIYSTANL